MIITLFAVYFFYDFTRSGILASEREDIQSRMEQGGGRMMMHGMGWGRSFPPEFLVGSDTGGTINVLQDSWSLKPDLWREGLVKEEGEYFLFLKVEKQGVPLVVGKNISSSIRSLDKIRRLAFLVLPPFAVVILLASYALSEYLLRPLRAVNRTLAVIGSENLSARFPVKKTLDEVEELKLSLNVMLNRIEEGYLVQQNVVANVSHELRTPLSTLLGYASMLQRWGSVEENVRGEALAAIETTAREMKELTENLLLLNRSDQKMEKKSLSLVEFLPTVVERWKGKYSGRAIILLLESSPVVETSSDHLQILLDILLDNALKYTTGDVFIRLKEKEIEVEDRGPGMPEEVLSHLGTRFSRGKDAHQPPGWGIGISLAREISRKLDIELQFENRIDEVGLRVTIRFPVMGRKGLI
ncbi:MAG: HAMP domain-containing sensor histidine kinase [Atribacterota bacterium]